MKQFMYLYEIYRPFTRITLGINNSLLEALKMLRGLLYGYQRRESKPKLPAMMCWVSSIQTDVMVLPMTANTISHYCFVQKRIWQSNLEECHSPENKLCCTVLTEVSSWGSADAVWKLLSPAADLRACADVPAAFNRKEERRRIKWQHLMWIYKTSQQMHHSAFTHFFISTATL